MGSSKPLESVPNETWCVIELGEFRKHLERAASGESVDMVLLDFLANSDSETVEGQE